MSIVLNVTNIITFMFFLVILSYYVLIFIKTKKPKIEQSKIAKGITIIMPAHNEEKYIAEAIDSVLKAKWPDKKQLIIIDDGSTDKTFKIASQHRKKSDVTVLRTQHNGKSKSINLALKIAKYELIAIVDADSYIHNDALIEISKSISPDDVAAACAVVKVKNRKSLLGMWLHIEQLYNSQIRMLFSKINANIVTPGPLSVYKKKYLLDIGGFGTRGFSEDVDVTIRLVKKGYKIAFAEKSITETNMPLKLKEFMRQRTRFIRGMINIFKRYLRPGFHVIDFYTLPLLFFGFVQAIIMGSFTIYQLVSGYITYFYSKGVYLSFDVAKFFFDWFSIVGILKWLISVISGPATLTLITAIGLLASILSYPLYLTAIFKFDKKIDIFHIIPVAFMFPFWLLIMIITIFMLPEVFRRHQYNIWKKNE